ncbi:type IV toxin-antitoxin system AbiEi family antitoxin [Arenibacter sp. BSSL-BM3]|uniref:Type IV toxin-antitoxin system AbiEi family antitoxin n=1 Tax=Arenibacter arenosicollis TaxID=2762274 RepID=A0ABR7QKM3_9FLAO|nr:type IV toxin-antitoxin system AbiEi family antitoxin [Arenibacter arenosicollis]MBC8767728.1 type IV toxin-antitoxin system AbiEi family antitoxin [Arenibacter arenosicollis]
MSTDKRIKINQLLSTHAPGVVYLSSWLVQQGYSLDLQKRYRNSDWFTSIGTGAMIRSGDKVGYEGALYALQKQAGLYVHPGGKTALSLLGKSHYLELSANKVTLFGGQQEKLPTWCKQHDWGVKLDYHSSSFLPANIGLVELELKTFSIKVSSAARAMLECLFLAPKHQELIECYQLMEGLNNLRPNLVQDLLENCTSIKVNRLFMYLAEKANHNWVKHLNMDKINLGSGKRSIVKNGVYDPKYKITVPVELANGEL